MIVAAGHRQTLHDRAQDAQGDHVNVADLLVQLSAQIDSIRQIFDGRIFGDKLGTAEAGSGDVVFVDDLAHCMECSWAKLEAAAGTQLAPDVVAQCGRLLETTLQILQQIQNLHAGGSHPATDIVSASDVPSPSE